MNEIMTGQIWAISATEETPPLLICIGRIDAVLVGKNSNEAFVVSASIHPHPSVAQANWRSVWHLPIAMTSLNISSGKLVREDAPVNEKFESGYELWRQKFERGEAGFFSLSAAEAYFAVNKLLKHKKP